MRCPRATRVRRVGAALVAALATGPAGPAAASAGGSVPANPVSMVDCNGHSLVYQPVKVGLGGLCADPIEIGLDGRASPFEDNGIYIGHDEPSVKFISSDPGSGNSMTYVLRLARDPKRKPTVTSPAVTHYAELTPAPWFGLPLCDPKSYPQNACTPD